MPVGSDGATRRSRVTDTDNEHHLICEECAAESPPDATGWRVYLNVHGEAVMFCPNCVEREFGNTEPRGPGPG
jgi:hypothetical protein